MEEERGMFDEGGAYDVFEVGIGSKGKATDNKERQRLAKERQRMIIRGKSANKKMLKRIEDSEDSEDKN